MWSIICPLVRRLQQWYMLILILKEWCNYFSFNGHHWNCSTSRFCTEKATIFCPHECQPFFNTKILCAHFICVAVLSVLWRSIDEAKGKGVKKKKNECWSKIAVIHITEATETLEVQMTGTVYLTLATVIKQ